jgi:hypothetical protein
MDKETLWVEVLARIIMKEDLKRIKNMDAAFSKLPKITRGTASSRRKLKYTSRIGEMES